MGSYTPDERSKAGRLPKRTQYDADLVHGILNQVQILHVSFNAPAKSGGPQFPTILPMLGAVATYPPDEEPSLYLHGSSVARLFRLTNGSETPLCVCGTLVDGYVLALAPFHNSCNYRSAVAYGFGTIVEDPEEVQFALRLITNNSIPDRWENSRKPPTKAETQSTGVLKMRIETASAKVRAGGPSDDRADLENADLVDKTWTGVVPTYLILGEPIASDYNRVKQVPVYLDDWVQDVNSMNEQRAIDAVDDSAK
ncbi:putative FMN-binding split barrel [Septoria linicola]|nr:putative FMN-binding split barrel [Septoria linicola]